MRQYHAQIKNVAGRQNTKKKLDEYTPCPLAEHACYKLKYSNNKYLVSSDTALIQKQIIFESLPLSAFAKHRYLKSFRLEKLKSRKKQALAFKCKFHINR